MSEYKLPEPAVNERPYYYPTSPVTSLEQGGPIIDEADIATPPQPAAQEQTSAVPVVRQMVVALDLAAPYFTHNNQVTAALAAGQRFIKENGK